MDRFGEHAVVIGGSVAGLMAARVLSAHFERVTVLESRALGSGPGMRKPVAQAPHVHALLLGGEQAMSTLYDGFSAGLVAAGAVRVRAGRDVAYHLPHGKAYSPGGAMTEPRDLGFDLYGASRHLLEHYLRQCTLRIPNVHLREGSVTGLACQAARVTGVSARLGDHAFVVGADLVVDATGRGSRGVRWLREAGFGAPCESVIGIEVAYASTCLRLPAADAEAECQLLFRAPAPAARGAILARIEGGLWQLTLSGRFGDDPPCDDAGFREFARALHTPRLHELLAGGERMGPIAQYHCPASVRRHYSREALPQRWLVLGDALCSFNPVYGQGVTVAAKHCLQLQHVLRERGTASMSGEGALDDIGADFLAASAPVTDQAWMMAAQRDFAFPQTRGVRPDGLQERARYAAALEVLIPDDPHLHRLVAEVVNLARPSSDLFDEPWGSRVRAELARVTAEAA